MSLQMSQPRVAHHLKILVSSGLIEARRDGRFMRYTLPTTGFEAKLARFILDSLAEMAGETKSTPSPRSSVTFKRETPPGRPPAPPSGLTPGGPPGPLIGDPVDDEPVRAAIEDFLL